VYLRIVIATEERRGYLLTSSCPFLFRYLHMFVDFFASMLLHLSEWLGRS
jgi:hypothetical protein